MGPAGDYHLGVTDLLREDLVLVGTPGSKLVSKEDVAVADLGKVKLVLPSNPHGLRLAVEKAAKSAHTRLNIAFEADSFAVLKDLVKAGLGYTILPLSAITLERRLKMLDFAPLDDPKVERQVVLGLPTNRTDTRATKAVAALVLDEITQLLRASPARLSRWGAAPAWSLACSLPAPFSSRAALRNRCSPG